jgi:hypothetical protein
MIDTYSSIFSQHPSGVVLIRKLEDLIAGFDRCLTEITGPIGLMNGNTVVALGPF